MIGVTASGIQKKRREYVKNAESVFVHMIIVFTVLVRRVKVVRITHAG